MYAIATSNAIGTGKNALTNATKIIPPTVTCATSACCGNSSIASATSIAAKIISGNATRNTYQKLFAYDFKTPTIACPQVSEAGISIGQTYPSAASFFREAIIGANTKIKNATVAIFKTATGSGNSANVIASTTTFSAGEANIAPSTDSVLIPDAYKPRAIGATQFVHTAIGVPATAYTVPNVSAPLALIFCPAL